MKWLKSGPELRMPDLGDLHVPAFLEDLYFDLKDRRLLPLVALAIVAIVAVPFLLSNGSSEPEAVAPPVHGAKAVGSSADGSLTVVRSDPGLRDYKKRLHRKPTDPFKQHFTAPQLAGARPPAAAEAATSSGSTTSSSTSTTVRSTATSVTTKTVREENGAVTGETETHTSSGAQGSPSAGNESNQGTGNEGTPGSEGESPRWIGFAVDVRIKTAITRPDGTVETAEPVNETGVRAPAPLPTAKTPVVTFLGADLKTGKLVVMVSEEVTSMFGEGKCLMGTRSCQLLEVEAGMPMTFVYGPAGERFKITFTKIERVPVELPKNLEGADETEIGSAPASQARAVGELRLGNGSG